MNKEECIDALRDWFESEDYNCEYDAEHEILRANFGIKGKLKSVRLYVNFHEHGYRVLAVSPLNADTDNLEPIMKYLHMANYGLQAGNFELDVRDGEIRYKFWVPTEGIEELPGDIIMDSIILPCSMLGRYGDGIAALTMGFSDPETEIQKVEGDDE